MHPVERTRLDRGWSRDRLAREAAVSPETVRLIETGHRRPRIVTAARIAAALELPISVVVRGSDVA